MNNNEKKTEKQQQPVTKPYEPPKAVVILFDDEDVITTSGVISGTLVFCPDCGQAYFSHKVHNCPNAKSISDDPI